MLLEWLWFRAEELSWRSNGFPIGENEKGVHGASETWKSSRFVRGGPSFEIPTPVLGFE